jgi:hypothetical protein
MVTRVLDFLRRLLCWHSYRVRFFRCGLDMYALHRCSKCGKRLLERV